MNLYVFASTNLTNVWAGIGARRWAVSARDEAQMRGLKTKAARMTVGSAGVIYCSATKSLTTPFLVYSQPDPEAEELTVWPERWVFPFAIHPLGSPRLQLHKDDAMRELPTLANSGKTNITHVLPIPATTVFSPVAITDVDWSRLLVHLTC